MNFIGHYFLDRNHPSPYFKLGIVVPDLMRGFNAKMRKPVFGHAGFDDPRHQLLSEGVKRHYEGDLWFHNLDLFHEMDGHLKEMILAANTTKLHYRTFFLSHIFAEMLIDRVLITADSGLPDDFYRDLNSIHIETLTDYFRIVGREGLFPEFFGIFERFKQARYLYRYTNNESFAKALLRVYRRIHTIDFGEREVKTLTGIALAAQDKYESAIIRLFKNATQEI